MGQRSRWDNGQDGLPRLKSAVKTIEPNWAKRSQLGPGSRWAWPILTGSQIGPRSQYGSEHIHSLLALYKLCSFPVRICIPGEDMQSR